VKLGELGVRGCVSIHLYGKGERLSLTYFPRPSTCKMRMKRGHSSPNKQYERPLKSPVVVRIDRKEEMGSGGGLLTL